MHYLGHMAPYRGFVHLTTCHRVIGDPAEPSGDLDVNGTRVISLQTPAGSQQPEVPRMDRRFGGQFLRDATLTGPESRGSSPVRLVRDPQTRESPGIAGLYPCGEGAGYAGGIVSAAVDGLRTARAIVARHALAR